MTRLHCTQGVYEPIRIHSQRGRLQDRRCANPFLFSCHRPITDQGAYRSLSGTTFDSRLVDEWRQAGVFRALPREQGRRTGVHRARKLMTLAWWQCFVASCSVWMPPRKWLQSTSSTFSGTTGNHSASQQELPGLQPVGDVSSQRVLGKPQ